MNAERNAFLFLSDYGHLESIREQCAKYNHIQEQQLNKKTIPMAVYKFILQIDIAQLCEEYAQLGNDLLHDPASAWESFHQVVFKVIRHLKWLPNLSSTTQLLLVLRLSAIPDLPGYTITHLADLPKYTDSPRFVTYTGIVSGMGIKEKFTESACFHCSSSLCPTRKSGDKYIRMHITGYTEAMTLRGDLTCTHCSSPLSEDIVFRILSDKLLIHMIPIDPLTRLHHQCNSVDSKPVRYQALPIVLRGDLCDCIQLGQEYTVIGIPVHESEIIDGRTTIKTTLEANNVYPSVGRGIDGSTVGSINLLSKSVADIYEASSYSPWTFTATLAYSFAADLFPPGIYHRLKLLILLSIVAAKSTKDKKSMTGLLNMLVHGRETHHVRMLLEYGSQFALRVVNHCSNMDIIGSNKKDWTDAGSVSLSSNGVCVVDNISCMKSEVKKSLQKVLEDQSVTIKSKQLPNTHVSHPLTSTLWAINDAASIGQTRGSKDSNEEFGGIPKHLMDHFDIITVTDPLTQDNEDLVYTVLTDHILQAARGNHSIPLLIKDDYKKLLDQCSQLSVCLSSPADILLRGYYLASRRARDTSVHGTIIPTTAMDSLVTLALSHARLSLRPEALEDDAVIAIMLYEEGLTSRTGYSPLNVYPVPHVQSEDISEYIGIKFDHQMKCFRDTITSFIKTYVTTSGICNPLSLSPEE